MKEQKWLNDVLKLFEKVLNYLQSINACSDPAIKTHLKLFKNA